jgi:hypothetical protein
VTTTEKQPIELADLERLATVEAPDLVEAIQAFLEQGQPELVDPPADAVTLDGLRAVLQQVARHRDRKKRRADAHEAWKRYLAQSPDVVAPQVRLADLIVSLYEKRTDAARAAVRVLAAEAPLVFGVWGGLKRVYKLAEKNLDAEMFGALAARFDIAGHTGDVQYGTLRYLQRRGWRFLRLLGKALPELYPQFAVEVLRSYPAGCTYASIASHIERHHAPKWGGSMDTLLRIHKVRAPKDLPKTVKFRAAYLDAWLRSPDPLMLLLETCKADFAASFAINGLRELFPAVLRTVTPEWLGRLAARPLPSAHDFLVETLEASPEFHQGKLRGLGLHDAVLLLLVSPSAKARKYAIEYARGHASDLPIDRLIELMEQIQRLGQPRVYADTVSFVASLVTSRVPRQLGVRVLGRLVGFHATKAWAAKALKDDFERGELGEDFLIEMLLVEHADGRGESLRREWAQAYINEKYQPDELPLSFWIKVLGHPIVVDPTAEETPDEVLEYALEKLRRFKVGAAPSEWLLEAMAREDIGDSIGEWLEEADALPPGLDLERIKGLVFDPERRQVAFALLGNPKLVSPGQVGLGWLLALARRADPRLHEWAHRYLLQHMKPGHFAEGREDAKAGIARVFALATGPKEPEAVRTFAQTYLRCHHPKIGKEQPESKQFHIKPAIPRQEFTEERVWPALSDTRGDVRRFAATITRVELRRWGAQRKVYELAESSAKEVRTIAYDALSQTGDEQADPDLALLPEELDAAQIFSMTESRMRSSRDVAIELIRKHYTRIGGAQRLGWLMQSADREVRFFAVRLLWEKHRPRGIPAQWKPPKGAIEDAGPFDDAEALRALLRRVLFMIPHGRSMEQLEGARTKKAPASVVKRSLIEIVRDLAVADAAFAAIVAPVLGEITGSVAKGEWQACLSALMTLRRAHGLAVEGMV